ncbi:MAG: penicillin-binding transpeptidase domain-containing protein [Candidatus Hydrogenedentes bacterium]|nr:penicillin-binding transpeptidase domain-containing protein [Candidatus Hydrogenedentota bacterium]
MAYGLVRVHTSPDSRLTKEELAHIGEVELRVPRGEIRDREGELLAKDRVSSSIWADPREISDPEKTASLLSATFNVPEKELAERFQPRDEKGEIKKFVWVKRWLADGEVTLYDGLDPALACGLNLKEELVRFYPEGDLAAHVLGFVNKEGAGCEGVEMAFDKNLRCVPGKRKMRVDARRRMLESLTLEYVEEEGGESVYLTLDKSTQRALEQALDNAMAEYKAPRAMGMIIDPKTGAILALACRPAFNPNQFWDVPPELYKNRALVDVFEPGSSFKIVTFSAALERGLVNTGMMIDCENGMFNPYGHLIRDYHKMGIEPLTTCFAQSSNIATIKIAALLGPEGMEQWMRRFGFGAKACEKAFMAESRGILRPRAEWSRLTMGAVPIGQEVAVTMPQLARAFCVIANGGVLVEPYIVDRIVDRDGAATYQHQGGEPPRVISEKTAATMRELCHLVVTHGTGAKANIPEYRVGGKTGTAQIAKPEGGGYYADKYTAIFAGFAPVGDPKLAGVIIVQEPDIKLHFGGYICGPIFQEVVRDALIRMKCPLDPVAEYVESERALEDADAIDSAVELEGLVAAAAPATVPDDPLDDLELVSVDPAESPGGPKLRDLAGMTKRQVKEYIDLFGLRWDVQGAGRVVAQEPAAGTPLRDVTLCRLVFASQPMNLEKDRSQESGVRSQNGKSL